MDNKVLNRRSKYLVVVIPTYNRLNQLKKSINSLIKNTKSSFEIIVVDGGSTDGTVEYLKNNKKVTSVFLEKPIGFVKPCNLVWKNIDCKYTCFFNDDAEIKEGGLDEAVEILEENKDIGLVNLKTKDLYGPNKDDYLGGLTDFGVVNCNFGVIPLKLLKEVNYFNEKYYTYFADHDLTTSVLCLGKKTVMTKKVCVLHHNEWFVKEKTENKMKDFKKREEQLKIFLDKFNFLKQQTSFKYKIKSLIGRVLLKIRIHLGFKKNKNLINITLGRFIRITDPFWSLNKKFHLVQKIPDEILDNKENPYYSIFKKYREEKRNKF